MSTYKLDMAFYTKEVIEIGIQDFKEYVEITFHNDSIEIDSENSDEVFHEFMNYLIWIYNQK